MSGPPVSASYSGERTLMTLRPTRLIAFRYYALLVVSLFLAIVLWFAGLLERYGNVKVEIAGWTLDHILAIVFLVIALYAFLRAELKRATTRYIITDNKVIRQDGILSKNTQMMPYTQLERVDLNQSLGQRILHVGTIVVDTGDDTLDIEMIPHPAKVQEMLSERLGRRAYVQQR